ncbi:MAG: DNA primase [Phycisphaerae bacterium]|nr:DNA primase [Phycisphaerae bacterium]
MRGLARAKQAILDRASLIDVVGEHVSLRRSGRRWVGLCPFHNEKTPSFTVNPDLGIFKCFGCGKSGDLFSFVMEREQVSFVDAMRLLADRTGVRIEEESRRSGSSEIGRPELIRVNAWAQQLFSRQLWSSDIGRSAREYVERRGIVRETAQSFSLGLSVDDGQRLIDAALKAGFSQKLLLAADLLRTSEQGRVYATFRNRLMFPIRDAGGRVLGFGGRTLGDDPAKYINTRQTLLFDKGRGLYGIDLARESIRTKGRAVLVEGYTDCMLLHQAGFTETVATLGTALTPWQVDLLRRFGEQAVIVFDSDAAGETAADRAIGVALPRCLGVSLAQVPEGKDPADFVLSCGAERFSDVLNGAVEALRFKWSATHARFDGNASDAGRREALERFLQTVGEVWSGGAVDAIQRGLIVNQVSHLLKIDAGEVSALLSRHSRRAAAGGDVASVHRDAGSVRDGDRSDDSNGWVQLLEVVLAEPGLFSEIECFLSTAAPQDVQFGRLLSAIRGAATDLGEFRLQDVLIRCDDPADVVRLAELAERGLEKANYAARLRVALDKINDERRRLAIQADKRELLNGNGNADEERVRLTNLSEGLRSRRHFAGMRLASSHPRVPGPDRIDPAAPDSKVVEQA